MDRIMLDRASVEFGRTVYCLPVITSEDIPIPNLKFRRLLESRGMKAPVEFLPNTTPARVRENISKAFRKSFGLRSQELLQFDYLAVVPGKNELRKPKKLLHFDSKTILSFVGKSNVFIMLRQQLKVPGIDWKMLLFQEKDLMHLPSEQYKKVMLSVMHQLSTRTHKDTTNPEEKRLVERLLGNYGLNEFHQLVFTGNCFDQLVLFTENRREEAFKLAHIGMSHHSLGTTFRRMYTSYYWNNILEWVTVKVSQCPGCHAAFGKKVQSDDISVDTIVDEIVAENAGKSIHVVEPIVKFPTVTLQTTQSVNHRATDLPPQLPVVMGVRSVRPVQPENVQGNSSVDLTPLPKQPRMERKAMKRAVERLQNKESDESSDDDTTQYMKKREVIAGDMDGQDYEHSARVLSWMYELQKREIYCDFFITLLPSSFNGLRKPKVYQVHKAVLAAQSPRVRRIQRAHIKIGGKVSYVALANVIEYAYTGKISNIADLDYSTITHTSTAALALDIEINAYIKRHRSDFVSASARVILNKQLNPTHAMNPFNHELNDGARMKAEVVELPIDTMETNDDSDDENEVEDDLNEEENTGEAFNSDTEWRPEVEA